MGWRSTKTAPRDGTMIVGLFSRAGRRSIALMAAFDRDDYSGLLADPAPPNAPDWVKDAEEDRLARYRSDPSYGFRPLDDDRDHDVGPMVGWRPAKPHSAA